MDGKILCTSAAYFVWVNSNCQFYILFMIYPKNRKCFFFPESLANKQIFLKSLLKFLNIPILCPRVTSQFNTVHLAMGYYTHR